MRTTGHGFVGIGRKRLLNILQARAEELGVELIFEREVNSDLEFPDADLIVACRCCAPANWPRSSTRPRSRWR